MKLLRSVLTALTALALPTFGLASRAAAQEVDGEVLYKKVVKSCVFIVTPVKGGYGMGSGSLIDADKRLVLTNFHVVDEENIVFVQFPTFMKDGEILYDKQEYLRNIPSGRAIKGKVLYRDKSRDLAIVQLDRIPAGTPAIPLAKKSAGPGATVWNIGNAGAIKQVFRVAKGEVSAVGVEKFLVGGGSEDSVFEVRAKMVTATTPTNPGDSGGPLFDKRGYQVAVVESGSRSASLVNHFVDITEVRALLNEKKIQIKELSDEPDPKGTEVKKGPKKDVSTTTVATPPKDTVVTTPKKDTDTQPPTAPKDQATGPSPEAEKAAGDLLRRAAVFASDPDNKEYYMGRLHEIIKKYPGTAAAKEAQKKLDALK
jgi:hypothetical protein